MFEEKVTTPNGNEKTVMASTQEELKTAVADAKAEPKIVTPNIDNPDDGNKTVAQFQNEFGEGKVDDRDGRDDAGLTDVPTHEAVPSADGAKEAAKDASKEAGLLSSDGSEKVEVKTSKK